PARDPPEPRRDNQAPRDGRSRLLVQSVTDQARDRGPVSSWPGGPRPFTWEGGGRDGIQRVAEPAAGGRVRGRDPQVPPLRGATFRSEDDAGRGAGRYLPLLRERLPPGHPPGAGPTHRNPGGRPMTPGGVVLQPPAGEVALHEEAVRRLGGLPTTGTPEVSGSPPTCPPPPVPPR